MVTTTLVVNMARAGKADDSEWFQIAAFGDTTDILAQHKKGDRITVTGDLRRNRYTGRNGGERVSRNLTADGAMSERPRHTAAPRRRRPHTNNHSPSGASLMAEDRVNDLWNGPTP
jgi:single-stranded DNA-binding protein